MPSELALYNLMPAPLRDKLSGQKSDVWLQELSWRQEHIFIQAPSGTGKTTLIHMLYGLRKDFDGAALWAKSPVKEMAAEELSLLRQRQVSVIFQDLRLFPALTAWENLEIKRVLTNTATAQEARDMMHILGISDRADRPAGTLSYGEQQRLAIIRAMLQPFKWLLMDEPFSHLDRANTLRAAALIQEVAQRNGASFLLADLDDNTHFTYTQKLRL